jgi:hypothetical protein
LNNQSIYEVAWEFGCDMSNRYDETWHRLREWTNSQASSERLAAQILLQEGYKDLDPSHPLGGKDGKKDAFCRKDNQQWIMAVYFPRGQKSFEEIKSKFLHDIEGVKVNTADALVFVTNQELRLAERQELKTIAGNIPVELFHVERITTILDQPKMHDVRKQFLQIDFREKEEATSVLDLLRLDIQSDCKLLQQLVDHDENHYLAEKWQSCLRKNRSIWQDISSRKLLTQCINDELMRYIQDFYEKLDSIEEKCQELLELKSRYQPLEAKPKLGNGILGFDRIPQPAWTEKYFTEKDAIALLNSKKRNARNFKSVKDEIQTTLDLGHQIFEQLSLQ